MPIAAAATGKPANPIATTQSGENTTPPMLAPLYAMESAAGRRRTNHGETTALIAAAPIAAQPTPLNSAAAKSCHGSDATAHAKTPVPMESAPAFVTAAMPKRR